MSDDETSRDGEEPYPIELMNPSHRLDTSKLDKEDEAELSIMEDKIKEAESFELTFEVVETSTTEEPEHVQKRDAEIDKILSPVVHQKESRLPTIEPFEFEEEAPENDENDPPPGYKQPLRTSCKWNSDAHKLAQVFSTPPSRKRKSLEDDSDVRTPKLSRRTKICR